MFCPMCGTKLAEDDNFCCNCGFKIVRNTAPQPAAPSAPVLEPPPAISQTPQTDESAGMNFGTPEVFGTSSAENTERNFGTPEPFNAPAPEVFDAPVQQQTPQTFDAPSIAETVPEVTETPAIEEPIPEAVDTPAIEEPVPEAIDTPAVEEPVPEAIDTPAIDKKSEFEYYSTDDGLVISSYNGTETDLTVPTELNGEKVIGIGNNAFKEKQITSLVLPQGIIYIGDYAFADCSELKDFTLPINAVFTDKNAFDGCKVKNLTLTDELPDEGTVAITDSDMFAKLVMPDDITNKLMEITSIFTELDCLCIPDHGYMPAEEETPAAPETPVVEEPPAAPETPVVEEPPVIEETPAASETPVVEETSEEFSYVSCGDGIKLTKYNGTSADVVLPVVIGEKNVKEIADDIFAGKTINSVKVRDFSDKLGYLEVSEAEALWNLPVDDLYKNMIKAFKNISKIRVPYYTDRIERETFRDIRELISVGVPQGVTSIADAAFKGCKGLVSVRLPDSITSIGENVFEDCTRLESVKMPFEIRRIGACAFSGCKKLTDLRIPNGITVLESFVFEDCAVLSEAVIPPSVTEIGKYAFYSCYSLETVVVPAKVKKIGECAFKGCVRLKDVTMPRELAEKLNFPPTVKVSYSE